MLCVPSLAFVLLALFSYAYAVMENHTFSNNDIAGGIISVLIWLFVIRYACKMGFEILAWVLAVGPYLISVFMGFYCKLLSKKN